jgi:16S rRNA processing protein RimM
MPGAPLDRLEVGRVVRAHGLRGEVVVAPITNREERFAVGASLDVNGEPRVIVSSRPHQDRWLVQFDGISDRDAAERLRGATLTAPPLADHADDAVWVHEVIGAEVFDTAGTALGRVVAVEANPAHDLLVLDSGPLVPMVFVVEHDGDRVVVDVPEGLLELFG